MDELLIGYGDGRLLFDSYRTIIPGTNVPYGIRMGEGFINALKAPLELKDAIINECRVEDGRRVVYPVGGMKKAARSITLTFQITANSPNDFEVARSAFYEMLYTSKFFIKLPGESEVYNLRYTGKSSQYAQNLARTACSVTVKFEEDNPQIRI